MSFLRWLEGLVGGVAAPLTGGASLGLVADALGHAATGIEAGRQQGRVTDAELQQGQDRNAMDAARLNLQAPGMRSRNAVQGDILSSARDFAYGAPRMVGNIPVPTSSGGLRPSIFSPQTKQLGALQSAQALSGAQTNGGNAFTPTPLPQPNTLDHILSTAGIIGGLGSMIPYKKPGLTDPTAGVSDGEWGLS